MATRVIALAMLNGSLDDEVIVPFLDGLCEAGHQGVCLHPRDGLLVPYASRVYWDRIDHIIGLVKERGLDVWYYDEFPFPSGAVGGLIPQDYPASRVRTLQFTEVDSTPNRHGLIDLGPGTLLALLRYREDADGAMRDLRDVTDCTGPFFDTWVWGEWHNLFYTGGLRVRKEPHERASVERFTMAYQPTEELGSDKLLAIKLITPPGKKQWPGMPDITLPEVTDLFLNKVYGRFAEFSKKHSLSTVPVFQDEVTFYCAWPWNREIENRLRPLWGDQLSIKLAALYKPAIEGWELARYEYRAACQNAIECNWYAKVAQYCHDHDLRMTGHLPGEEAIIGHRQYLGDIFKNLRHFDIPGYDIISSWTADDVNRCQATGAKLVQSVAWIEGRKPTMAEVFGAFGFHSDLQTFRTVLTWLGAHDITTVTEHATWTSTLSIRKYDAPPINTRFNPLSVGYPDLWQWHIWFADLMQEYEFDPEVLVLFPTDSLARYQVAEQEIWGEEVGLLETFFHYVCAHTQDNIFMPSYLLAEVEPVEGGFLFRGHLFKKFLVPPVPSIHESTFAALSRLCGHPGFCWVLPSAAECVQVFGTQHPNGELRTVEARQTASCTEDQLVEQKASWFDSILESRVSNIHSALTIIKSLRRSRQDKDNALLILINPNECEIEVQCPNYLGQPVTQRSMDVATPLESDDSGFSVTIAPRDILIYQQGGASQTPMVDTRDTATADSRAIELHPQRTSYRFAGPNYQSLKTGTATLEDKEAVPFRPVPVSSLWKLSNVRYYDETDAVYTDPFSLVPLPQPLQFEVTFPITLDDALEELLVAIDAESLPPTTEMFWDDAKLMVETRDIFDQGNTVYPIPAGLLTKGEHQIRFSSSVTNAAHGVVERPILVGRFLVSGDAPLSLSPMPCDWSTLSEMKTWPQMGMPEGYGPVEYDFVFQLSPDPVHKSWELRLPSFIGVAEVEVNEQPIGRSTWEPRVLLVQDHLREGENIVKVRVHGSWNNVFSSLNRLENGLTGEVVLRGIA